MDRVREYLGSSSHELETPVFEHRAGEEPSFFEAFILKGIRVEEIRPGFISCSFRVPSRLTDASGNLSAGAIADLVDEVGGAVIYTHGHPMKVSVDMSITYLSQAKAHDELEISSTVLGHKGGYSGTRVELRNRATGELVAEGRHSLFGKLKSKI
ncbi:Acyl-coenzyme A thioesterase 13 [Nymphaea thermarum]|nr:Acyl-coenzyme A thioesterase 13 [Nymphaea thermarum]